MGAIIEELARLMEPQAASRGHHADLPDRPELPPVQADLTRLRQVVFNLLSNAIKFTPSGGKVSITASAWEGAVMITVADTGIGMAETGYPPGARALRPDLERHDART